MVSFARAKTRSLLSKLWPISDQHINNESMKLENSKKLIENIKKEKKYFLEASKNGGIWFS